MKKLKEFALEIWKDESAQGATEYILMLVAVIALAAVFKTQLVSIVETKLGSLSGIIQGL